MSAPAQGRRQSNLADIQSDQESLSSSSETLLTANNNKTNGNSRVKTTKVTGGPRRTMSVKETGRKSVVKVNVKTVRALPETEKPIEEREEEKKVEDSVKMSRRVKDSEKIQQRPSSRSPHFGKKKSDGK